MCDFSNIHQIKVDVLNTRASDLLDIWKVSRDIDENGEPDTNFGEIHFRCQKDSQVQVGNTITSLITVRHRLVSRTLTVRHESYGGLNPGVFDGVTKYHPGDLKRFKAFADTMLSEFKTGGVYSLPDVVSRESIHDVLARFKREYDIKNYSIICAAVTVMRTKGDKVEPSVEIVAFTTNSYRIRFKLKRSDISDSFWEEAIANRDGIKEMREIDIGDLEQFFDIFEI